MRAAQIAVDEKLARPLLAGRKEVIERQIQTLGLRMQEGRDFEIADTNDEAALASFAEEFYQLNRRKGAFREGINAAIRSNSTLLAVMLLRAGIGDGMLCGTQGAYPEHLEFVKSAIGLKPGARAFAAINLLMLSQQTLFICDTYINADPSAEELTEIALLAVEEVRRFGLNPRVALVSHSSFGSRDTASAVKMRETFARITARDPDLEIDGEMHGDAALSKRILDRVFPGSRLTAEANLLIMPNLDAANITFNVLKIVAGEGVTVGPILLGAAKPVHILTRTSTVRRIVNMTALTAVDAAKQA